MTTLDICRGMELTMAAWLMLGGFLVGFAFGALLTLKLVEMDLRRKKPRSAQGEA